MSITKDSKEWLAALGLVPEKWNPGPCERCHVLDFNPAETLPSGNIAVHHIEHDIPTPDITTDLLYAIRRAIEDNGYTWAISYGHGYYMDIWEDDGECAAHEFAKTEDEVIIRAAASLQEAKS